MKDYEGGVYMVQSTSTYLTMNRNGEANEAQYFNGGYTTVPHRVYLNSAFTISVWIKLEVELVL